MGRAVPNDSFRVFPLVATGGFRKGGEVKRIGVVGIYFDGIAEAANEYDFRAFPAVDEKGRFARGIGLAT